MRCSLSEPQARQDLGFLPRALPMEDCIVPAVNLLSAAEAARATLMSHLSLPDWQGSPGQLPLLDVLLVSIATAAQHIMQRATRHEGLTADAMTSDMGLENLAMDDAGFETPARAALCPPETLARWSAHPALVSLAPLLSPQQAAREQLLRAAELPQCSPFKSCKAHAGIIWSTRTEPAVEQLVLIPIHAALGEGSLDVAVVLADLGFPCEDADNSSPLNPPPLMTSGGPSFEHFAALDLRLDRTQPPTLPLPEDDDVDAAAHSAGEPWYTTRTGRHIMRKECRPPHALVNIDHAESCVQPCNAAWQISHAV